uniref:NADH dehydrogenase subunit 6 n=1 Tax=Ornithodoros erraticus TaxID=265619 RepID=UPI0022376E3C|nr:NADH dehydrogenase subunit 6 [Ornithodoros erraticus]UYB78285.1 NADH dehydrogenase subunit 6 [Ornithodoros erraticus]UYB78298.1 NADH dehydrogenase subunit 6 [Ornithodoros erraticus]
MKLLLILATLFLSSLHPISMLMIMISTTIYLTLMIYMVMKHSWLSLIITLLMLGGLLVIFLYITSLTPNKKFILSKKMFFALMPLSLLINFNNSFYTNFSNLTTLSIFDIDKTPMLFLMLIYLLLTLLVIMKMINSMLSPLKSN